MQLLEAIERGDPRDVRAALDAGADPNWHPPSDPWSPLMRAANRGDPQKALLLLEAGADVKFVDAHGNSVLCLAVASGSIECINLFLDRGVRINCRCDCGGVLAVAALEHRTEIIPHLIARGADPNAKNDDGFTALMLAAGNGNAAAIPVLVDRGANLEERDPRGLTAYLHAAVAGDLDSGRLLLRAGADPSARDSDGLDAATLASKIGVNWDAGMVGEKRGDGRRGSEVDPAE